MRRDPGYLAISQAMAKPWSRCGESGNRHGHMPSTGCRIVGLHHVASLVNSRDKLQDVYARAQQNDKVQIEFAPELLRQGPAQHMMCLEPSGIRVEFIWPGN